jgi:nucleoside-diphosphate-sugar epimerase
VLAEQHAELVMVSGAHPGALTQLHALLCPALVIEFPVPGARRDEVGIVARMLSGKMRGIPRIGLEIVDVRDLADVHIRAMTSPDAAGQRFLATGEFMYMAEMARVLREGLGADGRSVPTRQVPDAVVRFAARFLDRSLREITPALGRRNRHTSEKARRVLGWAPRPARETVLDCARSLIAHGVA